MRTILLWPFSIPQRIAVIAIDVYQATLSPDHGPLRHLFPHGYCPHVPSCSEYGKQQIEQRGLIIGSGKLFWRLLHCHPWTPVSQEKVQQILDAQAKESR